MKIRNSIIGAGMILSLGASCPPRPPNPNPTPSPVIDLLLRQNPDGSLTRGGQPFKMKGAEACCNYPDGSGWPGFSKSFIDTVSAAGINTLHWRLGPFIGSDEPEYNTIGGPYLDASNFNPTYWANLHTLFDYAFSKGINIEVDLIDFWVCGQAQRNQRKMPWPDIDVTACGNTLTPTHKAWLTKVISEVGPYHGVIFQLGNEPYDTRGYSPQFEIDEFNFVRALEYSVGNGVVHMIGTNSDDETVWPYTDYITTHDTNGIPELTLGKFTRNNEHNPDNAYTPETERDLGCAAESINGSWDAWMDSQELDQFNQTLTLRAKGCEGIPKGACPYSVPVVSQINCHPFQQRGDASWMWDCTPIVRDYNYCQSIGFTGRGQCPVRQEGDPFRLPCEFKSMNGYMKFNIETQALTWFTINNYQFVVRGHGTGTLHCTTPATGDSDLCNSTPITQ